MGMLDKLKTMAFGLCCNLVLAASQASAEDIDIFVGASGGSALNANVLIVLDNTPNWSAADQHWPGGIKQGQSELSALMKVVDGLGENVNIGLMMVTGGGAGNIGGYIRSAIKTMTFDNKTAFKQRLSHIYNNFNDPSETASTNANYGNPLFDAFKYFGGFTSVLHPADDVAGSPTGKTYFGPRVFNDVTPTSKADPAGYTDSSFAVYSSPITTATSCANNYIIFIGNGFPKDDEAKWLSNVEGDTTSIAVQNYSTTTTSTVTDLGLTGACYTSLAACKTTEYGVCRDGTYNSCACSSKQTSSAGCTGGKLNYLVQGTTIKTTAEPITGSYSQPSKPRTADEWARYLYRTDVSAVAGQQNVTMFTIDVYKDKQDADQTALLRSMASVGGGKYYAANNEEMIVSALKEILAEVQDVNTTFASSSLPVNATNRAQNENQVFIGMFRPDSSANPRWLGNLKRYQLINSNGSIELGDVNGTLAVNTLTGFLTNCATSYWTTDSGKYWQNVKLNPPAAGGCRLTTNDPYSDAPDGPMVEKGAVAQIIRQGNSPPATVTTPTWTVNRTIYTERSSSLVAFDTTSSGLDSTLVKFLRGEDVEDENQNLKYDDTRASLHGDVVHSRPLPVNYGTEKGIVVYYGANDGTLRAVDAATGRERWAFIAPEFFPRLSRLMTNLPKVKYPNIDMTITPTPTPKDYFFDGTSGFYQNADNSVAWLYPSMRRGGRMIYALDVSNPAAPVFKWKAGCPNLDDDNGCTPGMSGIGQTWSTPNIAFVKGYSTSRPVMLIGGGYDKCQDANMKAPSCGSAKGGFIYALDAFDGSILATFATLRSVSADVSYVDIDSDGYPDYAYAVDLGGNIYRIDFINNPSERTPLSRTEWRSNRVAYTDGAGRKFHYAPAILPNSGKAYLALTSGDREHPLKTDYPFTDVLNRFYVYVDDLASATAVNLDDTTKMKDYTLATSCSTEMILPSSAWKGWFMNLNQYGQGEQGVTSALIAAGLVTFSTNRPINNSNQCSTALGEARGYWVNLLNGSGAMDVDGSCGGGRSTTFISGGLPPSPVLATGVPINGRPTTVVLGAPKRTGGVSVTISPQQVKPTIPSKRKRRYAYTAADN